jgi:BH3529 protein|nr:MAG TPA: capsid scaffolding protein [Caudoviricetes sp.]DAW71916.1 MAG TPA: capsid scaffolding protein [Caudoviricetes sp.]
MAEDIKEPVVELKLEQASTQEEEQATEKTFTQSEVDDLIKKRLAKQEKSFDKRMQEKLDEAEKLRKMNETQKAEYEQEKQRAYIAELEAKINRSGLEREASKMLSEGGISVDDKILGFVVKDTAEATQEAVEGFVALVNELADKKVSEKLKGKTPKKMEDTSAGEITKEQFNRMGYQSRNELLQNNPELYHKLKG